MARRIATLLLVFAYGSCMEMRETVERMVMVRTSGSDLQPAATGYIYKKKSNGPASVIKMGETEVIEHFSKLYKPEAYKAPTPAAAGPFYAKEEDGDKAAAHTSEEVVKPVVEVEHDDEQIDGLANEEYDKMFEEYAKKFSGAKNDFADYLHGLGHYSHSIDHGYGGGKDYDTAEYHGYGEKGQEGRGTQHDFAKGGIGRYGANKNEGYSSAKEGSYKHGNDDANEYGKHYAHGHGLEEDDHGFKGFHDDEQAVEGFHKFYDKDQFKKDHDFYDGEKVDGGHHKYADGHSSLGSEAGGYKKGDSYESGHLEGGFGKVGYVDKQSGDEHEAAHSSEEGGESGHHKHEGFGIKGEQNDGKSYGFEIKH